MSGLKPRNKFQSQKREFVAQKEFTDRELPKETFNRNLDELSEDLLSESVDLLEEKKKYRVLVYYGIGGIGKTSLKNELKKSILDNPLNSTVALEIDFREIRSRECANGLLDLYNSLRINNNGKLNFPHFEIAYAMYFRKRNPDIVYNQKEDSSMKLVDLGLRFFGLTSIVDFGISAFLTKEGINKVYEKVKGLALDKDRKEDLIAFNEKSLVDMEADLILFFADDLNNSLKKKNHSKVVVFIDTFEALLGNESSNLKKNEKAMWVKELILNLPAVLFVITGRDKINWGEDWEPYLDQHLISELAPEYSVSFLDKCGIEEDEIKQRIVNYSGGHPYYLDLSVDTYFSLKNENKQPNVNDFGTTKKEILERFITSLSAIELELLKVMSVPNFYNNDIFKYLIEKFNISYSFTQFDYFNQYSFVNFNSTLNRYTIHQLMRIGMEEYMIEHNASNSSPTFFELINEKLFEYFEECYESDKKANVYECIYHRLRLGKPDTFFDWLNTEKINFMKELQLNGETVLLNTIFDQINSYYKINDFPLDLFNIYEDIIHLSGNYKESVEIAEVYLRQFTDEQILSNGQLIKLKYRIIHHKMFFVKADDLLEELKILRSEVSKEEFFVEYCEITYMIGGGVGFLTGNFEECKMYLDDLIEIIENSSVKNKDLQNILTRANRKLVDYHRINGETTIAKRYVDKILDLDNLNRYQIYLCCSYADLKRVDKEFDEAIKYFDLVLKETKKLGIKGWQAHAYLSLANVYLDKGELEAAQDNVSRAFTIYKKIDQKWGLINSHILLARIAIIKKEDEFLSYLECAYEIGIEYNYRYELDQIEQLRTGEMLDNQILLYV